MGTEEKLAESERRFRLLLESIPHHVWSFHLDGSFGYWNQRLVDYTGLTDEELRSAGWEALTSRRCGTRQGCMADGSSQRNQVRGGTARTWP
jgi:PAS domain S-box-containing protein